jgi:hypothetical protein
MSLLDLPNDILIHNLFTKMELSDLINFEVNHSMRILVRNYIQKIARSLGFRNLQSPFELAEHLCNFSHLHPNDMYFFLIENIKNKIHLLTRFRNPIDEIQMNQIILDIKELILNFKKEWENNFDYVNQQTIIRYSIYVFLMQNRPTMGLTFQNKDTRILEKVVPKWDLDIQPILKKLSLSDDQIDEIRTDLNSKIFQLWLY